VPFILGAEVPVVARFAEHAALRNLDGQGLKAPQGRTHRMEAARLAGPVMKVEAAIARVAQITAAHQLQQVQHQAPPLRSSPTMGAHLRVSFRGVTILREYLSH
jgi:hypothetical protein